MRFWIFRNAKWIKPFVNYCHYKIQILTLKLKILFFYASLSLLFPATILQYKKSTKKKPRQKRWGNFFYRKGGINLDQLRIAAYARVSSKEHSEKELSIPTLLKAIHKYCQDKNYKILFGMAGLYLCIKQFSQVLYPGQCRIYPGKPRAYGPALGQNLPGSC